jgi:hypothetical protein
MNKKERKSIVKPLLCTLVVGVLITAGIVSAETVFMSNEIKTTMNIQDYPLTLEQAYPYVNPTWTTEDTVINSVVKGQPYTIGARITNPNSAVVNAALVFKVSSTDIDVLDFSVLSFTIGGVTTDFTGYTPTSGTNYKEWYVPISAIPAGTYDGLLAVTFSDEAQGSYVLSARIIQLPVT